MLAFVVGFQGQVPASRSPTLPFAWSAAAGNLVIHALTAEAEAAGFETRDRLITVDGEPVGWWFRSRGRLESGVENSYTC